jgi:hypothetical protein
LGALAGLILAVASGCAVRPIHTQTQPLEMNLEPVRGVIENGDWVVIRGVTGPDNFIGTVTNMPFSHASVYDMENDEVIEADSHGVHRTPLADYLASASRVWIVKPVWATEETRPLAARLARSLVGRPYDYTGLIGLGLSDSYYCSDAGHKRVAAFHGGRGGKRHPLGRFAGPATPFGAGGLRFVGDWLGQSPGRPKVRPTGGGPTARRVGLESKKGLGEPEGAWPVLWFVGRDPAAPGGDPRGDPGGAAGQSALTRLILAPKPLSFSSRRS